MRVRFPQGTFHRDKRQKYIRVTYMNYVIFDLEWNQSNTGKEQEAKELPFEVIEIGAVKLNSEMQFIGEFSQLVKPQVYHEMHHITRKLIHLQMAELEKGKPFPIVMQEFLDWCGEEEFLFCSWGPLDLAELQRNMRFYDIKPFSDKPFKFYDVQKLFSIAYEDEKSRRNLEYAIDFLKIEKDIPFHRAFSDAYYTGKVLAQIKDEEVLRCYSYDVFNLPKKREDEVHMVFDHYAKYISREFEDKADAIVDKDVMSTKCYLCHKNNKRKIKWFTPNGKHYYCISYCEKHGYMKSKVRIRRAEDGGVYVMKTMKCISSEEAAVIASKQERAKEIRKQKRHAKKVPQED